MIVVTGAAGFIGSNLVAELNRLGDDDIVVVDRFVNENKFVNLRNKKYVQYVDTNQFFFWLIEHQHFVKFIFHLGAKTDTTNTNKLEINAFNFDFSKTLLRVCSQYKLPLLYASSAATYGLSHHFNDNRNDLHPLNLYGHSKHNFDLWTMAHRYTTPSNWYGLKFFNVYGPNEYHKGKMASVIYHFYNEIINTRKIKLYKSYLPDYADGMQRRDFVYVKDLVKVMLFFMNNRPASGIYNVGSGNAETYNKVADLVCKHADMPTEIEYIDMPQGLREQYQYFTQANISKLRSVGYTEPMTTLAEGIADYVGNYLNSKYV